MDTTATAPRGQTPEPAVPDSANGAPPPKPGEQKDPGQEVDQADEGLIPKGDPAEGK
jgi:hypothetical protein